MKYFKSLFLVIIFSNVLNASMLYDAQSICIENFYTSAGRLYYQQSSNLQWVSTTTDKTVQNILPNYIYQSSDNTCRPNLSYILGMDIKDFNFLLGLIGVIIGGIFMFFTIDAFIKVGGKK
ncbi:MAG: hypothetical protein NTW78_09140 [Campylobacterales bacterium]|nr:hypothetical protein [Campylobacterales bacterium]